ncbi:hypothetical protein Cadr_000020447 [Camelus dromedarius]|uniref:Uncharacterized protein n=1 Tax=Camelus dromedarius TaxID=9838 RepID=A0A5N4D0E1_CAMDR|nr:hypothetical protein Cadr_000020447 [Camelus dromedarius]
MSSTLCPSSWGLHTDSALPVRPLGGKCWGALSVFAHLVSISRVPVECPALGQRLGVTGGTDDELACSFLP